MPSNPELRRLCLALCLLGGCATTAPKGWLPTVEEKPTDVYGSWLDLELSGSRKPERVLGELLGANADSLWVLAWDGPRALECARIQRGIVQDYQPEDGKVRSITLGASLVVPFINGFWAMFTWPLWWIAGGISNHGLRSDARLILPLTDWNQLAAHARFPQGIPPGLDLSTLEPRMPLSSNAPMRKISPPDKRPRKAPEPGQRIRDEL